MCLLYLTKCQSKFDLIHVCLKIPPNLMLKPYVRISQISSQTVLRTDRVRV